MMTSFKKWGFWIRLAVSLLTLGGLIYALRGKLGETLSIVRVGLRWEWFLLAIGIYFVGLAVISRRFQLVLKVQGVKVSFPQAFYLSFLGLFFNLFFPSALGGDIAKGYFAYEYSGKKLGSLTGVILDRILGFGTILLTVLTALWFYSRNLVTPAVERSIYGAVGILVFGTLVFSNPTLAQKFQFLSFLIPSAKWRRELSDFYHAFRKFGEHKGVLAASFVISLAAQFLFFFCTYLLARSLGIEASVWAFFLLMPLIFFVSMAPSISGLGVREAGFIFFFQPLMGVEKAFALSLLYDLLFYGSAIAAGVVFAFKGGLKRGMIRSLETVEQLPEVGHDR